MEKGLGHLFITSSSSNFFNKTDFEHFLFRILRNKSYSLLALLIVCSNWADNHRPVCRVVTCLSLEREVWDSNLGPVKSDTMLPTARHRCEISSKGAMLSTGAMTQKGAPPTRYTLRPITASIMKDWIWWFHLWCHFWMKRVCVEPNTIKFAYTFIYWV